MDDELLSYSVEYQTSSGMICMGGFFASVGLGLGVSIGGPILPLWVNIVGLCVAVASGAVVWSGFKYEAATNRKVDRYFERRRDESDRRWKEIRERRERLEQRQRRNQT